jgi:ABC-type transporter Mla subunit MlaD
MSPAATRRRRGAADVLNRLGERHALAIGVVVVCVIAFFTWIAVISVNTAPFASPFRMRAVVPADAPIVRAGDEVRIAGVRVGDVRKIQAVSSGRLISFTISQREIGRDATVTVRQRGFSGSVYLELVPGNTHDPLPEDSTLPRSHTSATADLASVVAAFGTSTQHALTRTLVGYGGGLAGRGDDINAMMGDLPRFEQGIQPVAAALTPTPLALSNLLHQLDLASAGFAPPGNEQLGPLVAESRQTLSVTAQQSNALDEMFDALGPFDDQALSTLPVATSLLAQVSSMAARLAPALGRLDASLPALNGLLEQSGTVSQLSRLAISARPVLDHGVPLLGGLEPVGKTLTPLLDPLVPMAQYLQPYRGDMVSDMQQFGDWSQFTYNDGMASGANAVRFGPVFTCARPANAYPAPGHASSDAAASLQNACQ